MTDVMSIDVHVRSADTLIGFDQIYIPLTGDPLPEFDTAEQFLDWQQNHTSGWWSAPIDKPNAPGMTASWADFTFGSELSSTEGSDTPTDGDGSDTLHGGAGADTLIGGFDRVNGGAGADQFFYIGDAWHGSDWIEDHAAAEGDLLVYGKAAQARDFLVPRATTPDAGEAAVQEVFITHKASGVSMAMPRPASTSWRGEGRSSTCWGDADGAVGPAGCA